MGRSEKTKDADYAVESVTDIATAIFGRRLRADAMTAVRESDGARVSLKVWLQSQPSVRDVRIVAVGYFNV